MVLPGTLEVNETVGCTEGVSVRVKLWDVTEAGEAQAASEVR